MCRGVGIDICTIWCKIYNMLKFCGSVPHLVQSPSHWCMYLVYVCVCACAAFLFHLVFISISPFRFHVPGSIVFAPLVFTSASFSFAFVHVVFMIGFSGSVPGGCSIPGRIVVAPSRVYVVVALSSRRLRVDFAFFVASPSWHVALC